MKETMIDVLMFLFDNFLSVEQGFPEDEESLTEALEEAGFRSSTINQAFDWLGELAEVEMPAFTSSFRTPTGQRLFSSPEMRKLGPECRGFLLSLEKMGAVDPITREVIIERAMALESEELTLSQFKRIAGLVLLNTTENEAMLAFIEDLLFDEYSVTMH